MSKKKNLSILKKLFVLVAVCALLLSAFVVPAAADVKDDPAKVTEAAEGVFLIMYCEPDPDDKHEALSWAVGSGFLINPTTVVTCYHVLHPGVTADGADLVKYLKEKYGSNWENKMEIRVYYQAGNFITASEIKGVANSDADYTAIKLSSPINGRKVLTIRPDIEGSVKSPDVVHALGYPYALTYYEDHNTSSWSSKDVDTRTGNVNKLAFVDGVRTINHSATLFGGMSGGPLVDAAGNVIGINAMTADSTYNYSISVEVLLTSLDALGIEYTKTDIGNPPPPTTETTTEGTTGDGPSEPVVDYSALTSAILQANTKDEKSYTAESFATLKSALSEAESVKSSTTASQADVDAAAQKLNAAISGLVEASSTPMGLIIGIVAAVVAIIVIVVIIVAVSRKGSKVEEYPSAQPPVAPPAPQTGVQGGFRPSPSAPAQDFRPNMSNQGSAETGVLSSSSETTVLGAGSNETTVLSAKPYATLTRKSNNETVKVAAARFVIGKERSKVSYCIDGNGAVSRTHAQLVKNGNTVNLVDLGSKNGTFLNGVRCDSNVPTAVKSGDKIVLADEEFTITLL